MKALFIANGIGISDGNPVISGGDIRWIEVAKGWQEIGLDIHVLTQNAGRELCNRMGIDAKFHIINAPTGYSIRGYMGRAINSLKIPEELKEFDGIIYSTTELEYDVIPGALIKMRNKKNNQHISFVWLI